VLLCFTWLPPAQLSLPPFPLQGHVAPLPNPAYSGLGSRGGMCHRKSPVTSNLTTTSVMTWTSRSGVSRCRLGNGSGTHGYRTMMSNGTNASSSPRSTRIIVRRLKRLAKTASHRHCFLELRDSSFETKQEDQVGCCPNDQYNAIVFKHPPAPPWHHFPILHTRAWEAGVACATVNLRLPPTLLLLV
jgi:hypothetical protein